MGWINTRPNYHVCAYPTVLFLRQEGDEWKCDECGTIWVLVKETIPFGEGSGAYGRKTMRRKEYR